MQEHVVRRIELADAKENSPMKSNLGVYEHYGERTKVYKKPNVDSEVKLVSWELRGWIRNVLSWGAETLGAEKLSTSAAVSCVSIAAEIKTPELVGRDWAGESAPSRMGNKEIQCWLIDLN